MYINHYGFAYLDIEFLSPLTDELLETRKLLGLRSPLHTVARMLNPFSAALTLQPVFHPNYAAIHQQAALLLGEDRALSFKGEGGENERIPERECRVYGVSEGKAWEQTWPALLPPDRYVPGTFPDMEHYLAVWQGEIEDEYAELAVIGTIALVLSTLEKLPQEEALEASIRMWRSRNIGQVKERYA